MERKTSSKCASVSGRTCVRTLQFLLVEFPFDGALEEMAETSIKYDLRFYSNPGSCSPASSGTSSPWCPRSPRLRLHPRTLTHFGNGHSACPGPCSGRTVQSYKWLATAPTVFWQTICLARVSQSKMRFACRNIYTLVNNGTVFPPVHVCLR